MVAGKFKNLYLDNDNVWFEEKRLGAKKTIKIPLDKVDSFEHGRYTLWILLILGILGAIIGIYLSESVIVVIGTISIILGILIKPEKTKIKSATNTLCQNGKGGEAFLKELEKRLRNLK